MVAVEIPMMGSDDLPVLEAAVELGKSQGKLVGAGTVISRELLHQGRERGAAFTVATGGVDGANLQSFLTAGAAAVSLGSALATPEAVAQVMAHFPR